MPLKPQNHLEMLRSYCAYQERSRREVEQKLRLQRIEPDLWEALLSQLQEEDFLNERRFAHAYVRGKFRIKSWGRNQIRHGLYAKGIPNDLIEEALADEIAPDDYQRALVVLIRKQGMEPKEEDSDFKRKAALMRKGYEPEEIREAWQIALNEEAEG